MRARHGGAVLSLLATVALLAACASDDDTSSPTSGGASPTTATAVTAPPASGATSTTAPPAASSTGGATSDDPTTEPSDSATGSTTVDTATSSTDVATPTEPTPVTAGPTSQTPPDPASLSFAEFAKVENPVDLVVRPNDPAMYAVDQAGRIHAIRDGVTAEEPVLDISADVTFNGEQGMLGLAFSADGGTAYVNYTNRSGDSDTVEYAVGADGVFDPASARLLLEIDDPYPNHNGGQLHIGPDGYLYLGMGDGGSGGDPERHALDLGTLLGKMLRIDPTPSGDAPYSIPADNPYVGTQGAMPEIFSVGLRNPWRYTFDRVTGDLWIADVGQGAWEEVDVAWAADGGGSGANFGWSAFEGSHPFNDDQPTDGVVMPIHEYEHGADCSISGGVRYRGTAIPELYGWYVYADYCSGQVRAIPVDDASRTAGDAVVLSSDLSAISEVAQDAQGELYVLSVANGTIYALQPA